MAQRVATPRLTHMLLEQKLVTEEQLKECIGIHRTTGESLPHILVERRYLSEEDLVITLSEQLSIPHIRLANYNIPKEVLDEVPESLARLYLMLPVSVTGDVLTLAMANPLNIMALDDLRQLTSYQVEQVVAAESELRAAIERHYGGVETRDSMDKIIGESATPEDAAAAAVEEKEMQVEDVAESALVEGALDEPVKRLARVILANALKLEASDIHVEPFETSVRLRYRIDGSLEEQQGPPKKYQAKLIARLKILSGCRIDERRLPQDGRFRIRYSKRDIDFRVAFLPCKYGEKVVLRVLDRGNLTLELDRLGFEPQPMAAFRKALSMPHGMILMTGPTGSGKTTTLYSALTELNQEDVNIVTVEDPIEYELYGINQVQTHAAIGLTFAEALRQILRQDPDIVMVGEIRDQETADVAVKAALTGHLVLSTLHTNDAAGVFPRLTDMGVEPFLVQSSVALAAAQRLLKRVCSNCGEPIRVPQEVLDRVQYSPLPDDPAPGFVRPRGCSKCKDSGYKGRVAVIEAMLNWPEVQNLIMERAAGHQIKEGAQMGGMRTLRQNALAKAARGITTIEQVLEHTSED